MCYIPSARVLQEGGYEAVESMAYYGQSGPFADDVEDRILAAIHHAMRAVGKRKAARPSKTEAAGMLVTSLLQKEKGRFLDNASKSQPEPISPTQGLTGSHLIRS